jgi:hypothetical protein
MAIPPTAIPNKQAALMELRSAIKRKSVEMSFLEYARRNCEADDDFRKLYPAALEAFQDRHGRIMDAYFSDAGGLCLTEKPRRWPLRWLGFRAQPVVRSAVDLSNAPPEFVALWMRADRLAIQIDQTLRGGTRAVSTDAVFGILTHLSNCLEGMPALVSSSQLTAFENQLEFEEGAFKRAAFRTLGGTYLWGMTVALPFVAALGVGLAYAVDRADLSSYHIRDFVGAVVSGALGAVVSALWRLGRGGIQFSYEVSRREAKTIGSSRPIVGAIFGAIIYFGLISELLGVRLSGTANQQFFALCLIAFIAGLNERFAREMLAAVPGIGSQEAIREFLEAEKPSRVTHKQISPQTTLTQEPTPGGDS